MSFSVMSIFSLLGLMVSAASAKILSPTMSIANRACFGAGCYWGTDKFIKVDFGQKIKPGSIKEGKVGFMSASPTAKKNPTYREVCSGTTEHVEVYDFEFDGDEKTYEALVKHFYMFHDPTTMNRQGNDRGTQYASAIFYYDDKQREIAKKVTEELKPFAEAGKLSYQERKIATSIWPASTFYPAPDDHQMYLEKQPWGYCNHAYRFTKWPAA